MTDDHLAYWRSDESLDTVAPLQMRPPPGSTGVDPCGAVGTLRGNQLVVRVPWTLDADEIALLAAGGTLWLSTFGGLPPHQLEVQAPPPAALDDLLATPTAGDGDGDGGGR